MGNQKLPLKNTAWQIVAAFLVHSISIQAGINMTYSTILLPQIMKTNENFNSEKYLNETEESEFSGKLIVDKNEASWIASLVTIATSVGSVLVGPLMDRFGRKIVCAFTAVPFVISWTLIATTTVKVYTIYAARMLAGVAGGFSTAAIVYVSEISHPSIRPMLLSLTSVFVSFGILLTSLLSYFLNWKIVAICCGTLALSSFVSILFVPETPSWIIGFWSNNEEPHKGLKRAERSLKWLYKNREDYLDELEALEKVKEQKRATKKDTLFQMDINKQITLRSPQAWKPLLILFILFTFQQLSGAYIMIFYAVQIFEKSGSVEIDQYTSLVILGFVRFVMAIISMFLSRKFGRRPLLISSGAGMSISVLVAGAWIYFFSSGIIPVFFLLLFVLFASYGVTVIPWTLIGELLPLNVRGKGSGFMVAVAYVQMFITLKLFIITMDSIGVVLIFICFFAFSLIFTVFVYLKIPETLGKTFQEIENNFK